MNVIVIKLFVTQDNMNKRSRPNAVLPLTHLLQPRKFKFRIYKVSQSILQSFVPLIGFHVHLQQM